MPDLGRICQARFGVQRRRRDGLFNNFPGWYVDDVRATGQPGIVNTVFVAS